MAGKREKPTATKALNLNVLAFHVGARVTVLKSMDPERFLNIVEVILQTVKVSDTPHTP